MNSCSALVANWGIRDVICNFFEFASS